MPSRSWSMMPKEVTLAFGIPISFGLQKETSTGFWERIFMQKAAEQAEADGIRRVQVRILWFGNPQIS